MHTHIRCVTLLCACAVVRVRVRWQLTEQGHARAGADQESHHLQVVGLHCERQRGESDIAWHHTAAVREREGTISDIAGPSQTKINGKGRVRQPGCVLAVDLGVFL